MNIIKDKSKRLNLSPMETFFIVKEESPKVVKLLEELNNDPSLTQGIFKFKILSSEMEDSHIKNFSGENNVILRLIENLGDEHQYLVNQINLNQSLENVLNDLKRFLGMASRQDIANIHKRINSYSSENPEDDDRTEVFEKFAKLLENAIKEYEGEETVIGDSDFNALGEKIPGLLDDIIDKYPSFGYDMTKIIKSNLTTNKKIKDGALARVCDVIKDILGVTDFEEILGQGGKENAQKDYLKYLPKELFIVLPLNINKKLPKNKRIIEFPIFAGNKKIDSIKFISPDRGILYTLILVKQREKSYLRREDFLLSKPQEHLNELEWIKNIFENLNPKGDFLKWYDKMGSDSGHPLSVVKSHTMSQIDKCLEDKPEINFFLNIKSEDTRSNTKYKISLSPENILLPEEVRNLNNMEISE